MQKFKSIILLAIFGFSIGKTDSVHPMDKIPDKIKKELVWMVKNNKGNLFISIIGPILAKLLLQTTLLKKYGILPQKYVFTLICTVFFGSMASNYSELSKLSKLISIYYFFKLMKYTIADRNIMAGDRDTLAKINIKNLENCIMPFEFWDDNEVTGSALLIAIGYQDISMFNQLIFRKINLNTIDSLYKRTSLIWIVVQLNKIQMHLNNPQQFNFLKQQSKYFIKMLLLAGADTEIKDKDGKTFFDHVNEIQDEKLRAEIHAIKEYEEQYEEKVLAPKRKQIADEVFNACGENGIIYDVSKIIAGYCV